MHTLTPFPWELGYLNEFTVIESTVVTGAGTQNCRTVKGDPSTGEPRDGCVLTVVWCHEVYEKMYEIVWCSIKLSLKM